MQYYNFFNRVLNNAKDIALKHFGKFNEIEKPFDNNQVLTEADLEIGKYIISEITKEFPLYNIIDEEAGIINNNSKYTFVIDPIDGTSNFSNGLPHYGCMFGLLYKNESIAGGIVLPSFNEIYYGEKSFGSLLNGNRVRVMDKTDLSKTLGCYGIDGYINDKERTFKDGERLAKYALKLRNIRTTNSIYDICKLVEGKYSLVISTSGKIWDNVSAQIIVEEAGGLYLDENKNRLTYTDIFDTDKNYNFSACAPQFIKEIELL